MKYYVVIDTNVLISSFLSKNDNAATVKVFGAVLEGKIIPIYNQSIISEYESVLKRKKFNFKEETIFMILSAIMQLGKEVEPIPISREKIEEFIDKDDIIFYQTTLAKSEANAYLVTGNKNIFQINLL